MEIKFIAGQPALIISGERADRTLVIADLHFGIECELGLEATIRKLIRTNVENIVKLIKIHKAKSLVILGDLRHRLPATTESELEFQIEKEIPRSIDELKRHCDVTLVTGNHDGGLEIDCRTVKELVMGDTALTHGHRWPSEEAMRCEHLIIAHTHPAVAFVDKLGHRALRKAWVVGSFKKNMKERYPEVNLGIEVIVMPSFNPYVVGADMSEGLLGPLLQKEMFKIETAKVYLLDGTPISIKKSSD